MEQRSNLEISDDENEDVKDEDEEREARIETPDSSLVSPSMVTSQPMMPPPEPEFQQNPRTLPLRYNGPPLETQPSFSEPSYMPRTVSFQAVSPNSQDASRRTFASPTFNSPQQGMYGWGQQPAIVSNGPSGSFYAASPHNIPHSAPYQLPPPQPMVHATIPPPQPQPQHHFEMNANGPRFEAGPSAGTQVRIPMNHGLSEYYQENPYAPVEQHDEHQS